MTPGGQDALDDRPAAELRDKLDDLSASGADRVAVIVLTWNSADHVTACLDSVRESRMRAATLVIDNSSTDESVAAVEGRADPDVVLCRTGTNLGYAGGINLGLSLAAHAGADFVIVLNPDATIDPECIGRLVDALSGDSSIGLASPAICYPASDLLWYGGSEFNRRSGSTYHLHEGEPLVTLPKHPFDTGRASGCVLALVPARLQAVGSMDERYFLYYEEVEWSIRIKEHNFRIVVVPSAVAWHDVGHGSGSASPAYLYYMTRNRLLLASQHGSGGAIGALPGTLRDSMVTLLLIARKSPAMLASGAGAIARGYLDFARGRFGRRIVE